MGNVDLLIGNCRDTLKELPDASVDSVVCDPPYELGFMGKSWDSTGVAYDVSLWAECLRVLKPGGHLLAFGGSRTYHRLACAVEDAGFEIRDQIMWVYGSGFPKSLNVAKSIEAKLTTGSAQKNGFHKLNGERKGDGKVGMYASVAEQGFRSHNPDQLGAFELEATTDAAKQWDGWGTALKPAHEPIVMARKPLAGTVAANVLEYGTGAINIDGCRVPGELEGDPNRFAKTDGGSFNAFSESPPVVRSEGRWPANFIHDGSDEATLLLSDAARFFYCSKPGKKERSCGGENRHPTVKPLDLMRYLVRLVTPIGGTVLDPFAGSGTTLMAAVMEQMNAIGCEITEEYVPIINGRVEWAQTQTKDCLF